MSHKLNLKMRIMSVFTFKEQTLPETYDSLLVDAI